MYRRTLLTPYLILVVGFLTVCPIIMLLLGSFSEGLGAFGTFTLQKYLKSYTDPALCEIIVRTILFMIGSAVIATALALFMAYLNTRTNIPYKGLFQVISLVPMMVPHILFAVSWSILLNPSNGLINLVLKQAFHLQQSPFNIYSLSGMMLVEGLLDLPVAYLIIAPAMSSFDVSLEESSRVCGSSNLQTLFKITLPVLRPAILASITLVAIRSLESFAVPSVLGMPGRIYLLSTHIYRIIATGFAADYGMAAAVGMSALAASLTLIILYRHLTSESEKYVTISGRGYRPTQIDLRRAKLPFFLIIGFLSFILIVLPVMVLLYTSLVPYSMVPGLKAFSMMSLKHWMDILKDPVSLLSVKNSLFLGVVGATLGVILTFFISYSIIKTRTPAAGILESLSFLSFSFPGIVIGIGFMWFFVRTPLYATIWALLVGYIATYLPYGIRPLTSSLVQIHRDLEESSRVFGGGMLYTLRRIIVPMMIPGITSAWILMATMFIRELSVSVVLSRPGNEVLAVQILRFSEDGLWGKLSALGILMILVSTMLVLLASFVGGKMTKIMKQG